jgi:hybrid polyketide synthase/nonribosomal peptide synthetase ACE1
MNAGSLAEMALVIQDAVSTTHPIDWSEETSLPESLLQTSETLKTDGTKRRMTNLVVLLTGATGYLGRHILARLLNDNRISKVYCVATRGRYSPIEQHLRFHSAKLVRRKGDLGLPLLGLAEEEFSALTSEVDLIIHSGGSRSFWENYEALRASNVSATKELVKLALPRRIPFHFMSSGGVRHYNSTTTPPENGSDGYIASKWVSEQYLYNAAKKLGLPVYIHRPLAAAEISSFIAPEVLNELTDISRRMQARPVFDDVRGHIDIIPIETVIEDIFSKLLGEPLAPSQSPLIVLHESRIRVEIKRLVDAVIKGEGMQKLKTIPALEWVGEAKNNGFSYFITSHDVHMGNINTEGLVSRR